MHPYKSSMAIAASSDLVSGRPQMERSSGRTNDGFFDRIIAKKQIFYFFIFSDTKVPNTIQVIDWDIFKVKKYLSGQKKEEITCQIN